MWIGLIGSMYKPDYKNFKERINRYIKVEEVESIVTECDRGTEKLIERWARETNKNLITLQKKQTYKHKIAGYLQRNRKDILIALTENAGQKIHNEIEKALEKGIPVLQLAL